MTSFASDFGPFVLQHQAWAGPLVGGVLVADGTLLVGAFIPSAFILLALGGLLASGVLNPAPVLVWALTGSIAGDAFFFTLSQRHGRRVLSSPWMRSKRRTVARMRLLISRYGASAITLSRFAGPFRPFAPIAAGAFSMPGPRFHAANIIGGVGWVSATLGAGALVSRLPQALPILAAGAPLLLMGTFIVGALVWLANTSRRYLAGLSRQPDVHPIVAA